MGKEQCLSIRTSLACRVSVVHPQLGQMELMLRDLSDTGVFIETDTAASFSVGDQVLVQVLGLSDDSPQLAMTVARTNNEGVGLHFNEPEPSF
ncbi:MAG: PilZ domain-containing protein [Cellvibrio sp.]